MYYVMIKLDNIISLIKENKLRIVNVILLIMIAWFVYQLTQKENELQTKIQNVEYIDENKIYHKIQDDNKLESLKRENKELYDSLKSYKKQIDYLVKFKYDKKYDTGKVEVKPISNDTTIVSIHEYTYESSSSDTLNYKLSIGAEKEPNWYRIQTSVSDEFTIVNKVINDKSSETTIESKNDANISDVAIVKKKDKIKFFNRIAIGPSITYGYSITSKRLEPTIGISVTYNLFAK